MFKHLTIFCLFIFLASLSNAQTNLVPNGSFEEYFTARRDTSNLYTINAPTDSNNIYNHLKYWYAVKWSPDLYTPHNKASGDSAGCLLGNIYGWGIPENWPGKQQPRTDSCYIGLGWLNLIDCNTCGFNYYTREWAGVKLLDTLKRGQCYRFNMYVSLAERSAYNVSSLGAYLSKDSLFTGVIESTWVTTFPMPLDSVQVCQSLDSVIWDTLNWVKITGVFEAKGGELYINIGHLLLDSLNTPIPIYPNVNDEDCIFSYFYIDDVSLYETNEPCKFVGVNEAKKEQIKIYPNPAQDRINLLLPNGFTQRDVSIYSIQGQLLIKENITSTQNYIDISSLDNGLYTVVVQDTQGVLYRQKLIVAK